MNIDKLPHASDINKNGFSIRLTLIVSSSHFSEDDIRNLRASDRCVATTDLGALIIWISGWDDAVVVGISEDANRLVSTIHSKGYRRIEIDGEIGDVFDGFKTFDW